MVLAKFECFFQVGKSKNAWGWRSWAGGGGVGKEYIPLCLHTMLSYKFSCKYFALKSGKVLKLGVACNYAAVLATRVIFHFVTQLLRI